jgi:hypothetical protein
VALAETALILYGLEGDTFTILWLTMMGLSALVRKWHATADMKIPAVFLSYVPVCHYGNPEIKPLRKSS